MTHNPSKNHYFKENGNRSIKNKSTYLKWMDGLFGKNYSVPNYFRNRNTDFEINRTIITCLI